MARRGSVPGAVIGGEKEQIACRYLEGQGLRLLARNHRCRHGEIDLVMRDADTLVFVEVRTKTGSAFGTPRSRSLRPRRRSWLQWPCATSRPAMTCHRNGASMSWP